MKSVGKDGWGSQGACGWGAAGRATTQKSQGSGPWLFCAVGLRNRLCALPAYLNHVALLPLGPVGPVPVVLHHAEGNEMVDLFGAPVVQVAHFVNAVDDPCVVLLLEFLDEVGTAEEIVGAPRTFLVFVAELADMDGLLAVAVDLDAEVDPFAAKVLWVQWFDRTTVPLVTPVVRLGWGRRMPRSPRAGSLTEPEPGRSLPGLNGFLMME